MRLNTLLFLVIVGVAVPACTSLAPEQQMPEVVSAMPETFGPASAQGDYQPERWWEGFNDPVLNSLIDDALAKNLDVAASVARLEQVRAQARLSRAARLPSVNASVTASESSTPIAGSAFAGLGGGTSRIQSKTFAPSVSASYELDLFERNRNDSAAAERDALASAYDLQSVRLATAAETISTYFEIVNSRRQIELTLQILDVLTDRAERTQQQYQRGLSDSFELYQIRQQLRSTQSSLPQLESALASAENRLAVLLGGYPGSVEKRLAQPLTPRLVFETVPAGLPAELLGNRPDVAAGWARLDAARLRIGARRAERYPQVSLSGSLGGQGGGILSGLNIIDNWTRSLAASIVAPIFDGGRIKSNIAVAQAQYDESAASYAATVLQAFQEADSAFNDYEEQRQRYLLITAQLDEADLSFDLQRRRYVAGVGSYIAYLDALTTVYQVQSELSAAAQSTAMARLSVHRALAGDWAPDVAPEKPSMLPNGAAITQEAAPMPETQNE